MPTVNTDSCSDPGSNTKMKDACNVKSNCYYYVSFFFFNFVYNNNKNMLSAAGYRPSVWLLITLLADTWAELLHLRWCMEKALAAVVCVYNSTSISVVYT